MNTPEDLALEMSDAPEALRVKIRSTNEPLSELEVASFNEAVLCKLEAQLSEADEQISELRATLLAREERRKDLLDTLARCRGVLSLMRGFPTDVLVEIFKWYCKGFDVFCTKGGPWHLAQVCSRWRHVVFDTPCLWSDFRLDSVDEVICPRESIRTCLAQSASVPLTIYFNMQFEDPYRVAASAPGETPFRLNLELLNMVMEHAERWLDVDLVILPQLMSYLENVLGRLPFLETLNYGGYGHRTFQAESDYPTVEGFGIAPRLRALTMTNTFFERVDLPLHALENLSLIWDIAHETVSGTSMDRLHYLVDCPTLRALKIIHRFPDEEDLEDTPSFSTRHTHHSLQVLHASDFRFLDSVTLPSLKELRIVGFSQPWEDKRCPAETSTSIAGLLDRSHCPLEILAVMDMPTAPIDLLILTPLLQVLHLDCNYWNQDVDVQLSNLFVACAKEALAPNLQILTISAGEDPTQPTGGHVARFVGQGFHDFVRSRWSEPDTGVSQIAKISIRLTMPVMLSRISMAFSEPTMPYLRRSKQEGLDISISTIGVFPSPDSWGFEWHEFTASRMSDGQTKMIYV